MRIYTQTMYNDIQREINKGRAKITAYKDYSFLTTLHSAGLTIRFINDASTNRRECSLIISNSDISSKFIADWKKSAPGKFLSTDYRKDKRDFIGNTLYHTIECSINGTKIKVLVRILDEVSNSELSDEDKKYLITYYSDIVIDGKHFSVIKIISDNGTDSWGSWERYKARDINFMTDQITSDLYIDEGDDNNDEILSDNSDDNMNSDPLF